MHSEVHMATQQDTSIEHELLELSDLIHTLLFLSEGDCTQVQLDWLSEQLTHILRYGKALGFHAAFIWKDGGIVIEWQPLGGAA